MKKRTRETQYQRCLEIEETKGLTRFGLMSNQVWMDDPRRITFLLSRYKFVSKMFSGMKKVLEVGCADAFGSRVVLQEVGRLTAVDFDSVFINDIKDRMDEKWPIDCRVHDMMKAPIKESYDGVYALDVIEHIYRKNENKFVKNMAQSLSPNGVMIVGTPSLESQAYASPPSREGHVNCKKAKELKKLMQKYFHNVFIFSMNDEVVHTGFYPMAHYLLALCSNRR